MLETVPMIEPIAGFYHPKTDPFRHQRGELEYMWDLDHHGHLFEMGTGKSKIFIDNTFMLREAKKINGALLFAPKGVFTNWYYQELPAHAPDRHMKTIYTHLWRGGGTATEKRQMEWMLDAQQFVFLLMNTESVSMSKKAMDFALEFVKRRRVLIGVDEASGIKNPEAKRTAKLIRLARLCPYRRILTGTPITRSPLDLFSEFEFLQEKCLGYSSYYGFRARYAVLEDKEIGRVNIETMRAPTAKVVVGHRHTDELAAKVAEHASVVLSKDCQDLPPVIEHVRHVEMTEEQLRLYSDLVNYATTEIKAGTFLTVTHAIALFVRFQQILCGHIVDDDKVVHDIQTKRLDVLQEVVEETSGRNLVWCLFQRDVEQVAERLMKMGRRVVCYYGKSTDAELEDAKFRLQGSVPVMRGGQVVDMRYCPDSERADDFVGTASKGGYGITLTAAKNRIYYSCGPNAEHRWQSEKRNHRHGQTETVNQIDLFCRGTVEERWVEILKTKKTLADVVMEGPARVLEFFS